MKTITKRIVILVLAFSLIAVPSVPAFAGCDGMTSRRPSSESMVGDVIVARPLGFATTAIGSVLFVVSLPFSALGGNTAEAAEKMVVAPARFTFARPLGG